MEPMVDPSILALTAQTGLTIANFLPVEEEDDYFDEDVPEIQRVTKKTNVLPLWGNQGSMNLNPLVLENIRESYYYKNHLIEIDNFQGLLDEVYYKVKHLEPWEKGTRKIQGMTGMCGGVRGVGAGGVVSSAFCLLFRFFNLRMNRRQLVGLINNSESAYARGMGFMYIRFTQPPADLWAWFEPYLDDEDEIDPRSGGGDAMPFSQFVRVILNKLDWYGTLFPRIPVPIQKEIDEKLAERKRTQLKDAARARRDREEFRGTRISDLPGFQQPQQERGGGGEAQPPEEKKPRTKCQHHLRHHHCRKHRKQCPKRAREARKAQEAAEGVESVDKGEK